MTKKILVLASGRGSDFQAIIDHKAMGILRGIEIAGLVCNHPGAPVIERAKKSGVTAYEFEGATGRNFPTKEERQSARKIFEQKSLELIGGLQIDYVALAGFDQIVTAEFVDNLKQRILNIHPACDLKRFGGKNMVGRKVHELVLQSGVAYSGCTVHFVTSEVDLGPAILKKTTPILPKDTAESLESRVLALEHLAYPEALQLVADGRITFDSSRNHCFVDRYSDGWDVEWEARQQKYVDSLKENE